MRGDCLLRMDVQNGILRGLGREKREGEKIAASPPDELILSVIQQTCSRDYNCVTCIYTAGLTQSLIIGTDRNMNRSAQLLTPAH